MHYGDVIMSAMTYQITSLTMVYSTDYSGADQRKHQSSASLAFVRRIHRWPVNSLHKGPVTRKMFPFDDIIKGKPGCTNNSCMYGGGQGAVDYDHIYDCKQCSGPASSSICARCLINGGTCEPGHDQWELVTWTVYIWIVVISSPLYRPTFLSWIPEWRTVSVFYFILFYMGPYVCSYMYHGTL